MASRNTSKRARRRRSRSAHVGSWAGGVFTDLGGPASFAGMPSTGIITPMEMMRATWRLTRQYGTYMFSGGTLTAIPGVSSGAGVYSVSNGNTAFGGGGWMVGTDSAAFAYNANTNTTYTFGAAGAVAWGVNNAGQVVGGDSGGDSSGPRRAGSATSLRRSP